MENNKNQHINTSKEFKPDQVFTPYNIIKRVILPYWPIYVLCLVAAFFISKYYLKQQPFIYEVYGKVLIKPELSSGKGQQVLEDLDMFASAKIVDNELEIIQSRMLCAEVGKSLNSYVRFYSAFDKRSPELDWDFPIQLEAINEDSLKGSGGFLSITIGSQKKNMRINKEIYEIKDQTIRIAGAYYKVRILRDKLNDIAPGVYKCYINSLEEEVNTLINSVTPAPTGKGTTIIGIRYRGYNVRNSRRILNEFISQYTSAGVEDKRSVAQYTMDFIEERLRLISGELDSVETNIEKFKQKTGLINVDQQASLYISKVMERDVELGKINLKLDVLKSIEQYLFKKKNNPGMVPSLMEISDPILSNLLTKLYELEFQYDRRLKYSGVNDETLQSIGEEIKEIKQGIFENIKNIRSNLEVNKQKIESELENSEAELNEIPTQEKRLLDISRQQAVKNEIFSYLLEKREESAISFASTVSDVRIIEKAYGGAILSPKPHLTYGLLFSLAISLPLVFFFWQVMLNPRVQFRDEIESILNIPILGDLMYDEKKRTIVTSAKDRGQLAESLRTIRTKLTYYKSLTDHKVLMVSSSIPGEGKSFISVNLGLSYSLINNKVVLVGGDLRKPALHKVFDMSMKKGLSSYLNGTSDLDEVVYATEYDNLWILPSGAIPPNPSELLEGDNMTKLMVELRERFDVVIIDTPPLGLVADAEIIARHCDVHMFVIRYNYTPKEAIELVLEKAKGTGLFSQFSVIFNGVKPKGLGKYGYYYGYAYNYGGYSSYGGYGYYGSTRKRTGISYLIKKILKLK